MGVVRETILSCCNRENIVIKVSAEDYDYITANEDVLRTSIKGLNELEIKKDASLEKGSCVIETEYGSVDGSADIRLQRIRKAFFELLGDGRQYE